MHNHSPMVTTDNQYSLKMMPNLIERRNMSSEHQHLQLYEIIPVNSSAFGLNGDMSMLTTCSQTTMTLVIHCNISYSFICLTEQRHPQLADSWVTPQFITILT